LIAKNEKIFLIFLQNVAFICSVKNANFQTIRNANISPKMFPENNSLHPTFNKVKEEILLIMIK